FAVLTGVVVAAGFAGVATVDEAGGGVVVEAVVSDGVLPEGVVVEDGVVEGVVDGGVVEAAVAGGVGPPPAAVVPPAQPAVPVVAGGGGAVEVPVAGVVDGDVVGVVDGGGLEAVEPVPVVGGVDEAAGVLVSVVGGALLPQMSSFETLASVLPVAGGVVAAV